MVVYLLLFRLTLPYALVRRNPERSLLVLLPFFHAYARVLGAAGAGAAQARRRPRRAARRSEADARRRRRPRCRPRPCTTRTRAGSMDAVVRFSVTLVRDVMTPRPDVVAVPSAATWATCGG